MALFTQPLLKIVNPAPKLRLRNNGWTEFSFTKGRRNLKLRRIITCLFGVLARTPNNEPVMQSNLKLRDLKSGFYCNCNWYSL
jgi:hypothetical protein